MCLPSPFISIIVPVYNAEYYLRNCIDSILVQNIIYFELLLIDDGSKDLSGKICDEYAAKYEQVKCIHQENEGVVAARATGILEAKGEYIYFVDADDTICPDALACISSYLKSDVDVVIFESDKDCVYSTNDYAKALLEFNHWVVWGKLFRKRLFDEYVMDIPRYFKVGEDFLMNLKMIRNIKGKIVVKPIHKYLYNQNNPNSVQIKHCSDYNYEKKMICEVDGIIKNLGMSESVLQALFKWKMVYLGGMIGLGYHINYYDTWIMDLEKEAKNRSLSLKETITVRAVHQDKLAQLILVCMKKIKIYVRKLICKF